MKAAGQLLSEARELYWKYFRPLEALKVCEQAHALDEESVEIMCSLANMQRYAGRYTDAKCTIAKALEKEPGNLHTLYTRCRLSYEGEPGNVPVKMLKKAEKMFHRLAKLENIPASILFSRILALSTFGLHQLCLEACDSYLAQSSQNLANHSLDFIHFEISFRRASCLFSLEKHNESLEFLSNMLQQNTFGQVQRLLLLWQRGRVFQILKQFDLSRKDFEKSLELAEFSEHKISCYISLSSLNRAENKLTAALDMIDVGIRAFPLSAKLYENKARLLHRSTFNLEEIHSCLEKARQLYQRNADTVLPAKRLHCLRLITQMMSLQPGNHIQSLQRCLEEMIEVGLDAQRSFSESMLTLDFLYDISKTCELVEPISKYVFKTLSHNLDHLSPEFLVLVGIWYMKLEDPAKGFEYLSRASLTIAKNGREHYNVFFVHVYVIQLVSYELFSQAWNVMETIDEYEFEEDDELRLSRARLGFRLNKFKICQQDVSYRNTDLKLKSLEIEFQQTRMKLYREIRVATELENQIKEMIQFCDDESIFQSTMEFLKTNDLVNCILDHEGSTPLMEFVRYNNLRGVEMLCNLGANINHLDIFSNSPVSLSSVHTEIELAVFLISRGGVFQDLFMYMDDSERYNSYRWRELVEIARKGVVSQSERKNSFQMFIQDTILEVSGINIGQVVGELILDCFGDIPSHICLDSVGSGK